MRMTTGWRYCAVTGSRSCTPPRTASAYGGVLTVPATALLGHGRTPTAGPPPQEEDELLDAEDEKLVAAIKAKKSLLIHKHLEAKISNRTRPTVREHAAPRRPFPAVRNSWRCWRCGPSQRRCGACALHFGAYRRPIGAGSCSERKCALCCRGIR
jgi:hypothetical protein